MSPVKAKERTKYLIQAVVSMVKTERRRAFIAHHFGKNIVLMSSM